MDTDLQEIEYIMHAHIGMYTIYIIYIILFVRLQPTQYKRYNTSIVLQYYYTV